MNELPLRVHVSPRLLQWAIGRSGRGYEYLARRFPKLQQWIQGDARPTFRQLESFATATYTPLGYLFLPEPPREELPLPDLRTVGDQRTSDPSRNLLETVYQCQIRQEWYRAWVVSQHAETLPFVGSVSANQEPSEVAKSIARTIGHQTPAGLQYSSWSAAVTGVADALGNAGVLVMINGVVGSDSHRPLNPEEFRGFTLVDRVAPLIFVNGADAKSAQLFTLAHESAHVWLGQSGVDNAVPGRTGDPDVERWCNSVAAEFLVPMHDFEVVFNQRASRDSELDRLARRYRVSKLVILSRAHEGSFLDWDAYRSAWHDEMDRARDREPTSPGGNFYSNLSQRVGKRFLNAVITTTLSGETLYTDAFRMLGIRNQRVFNELAERLP